MSVGLDIGSKTIKIVQINEEGGKPVLKGSGIIGFNANIDANKTDKDLAPLADAIKKLHKEARISSKDIVIAVPEQLVFTRVIKFPPLTDQEISSAVKWEAEQYIPIPVKEAIIQHQIIERRETSNPPEVSVLLVAAPRNLVEKYVQAVQMAKLNPVAVETELLALARALAPANQTALLLDFGAKSADIAITKNGQLAFSRSVSTAGDALTRAVAQNLGVDPSQAEQYKRAYGLSANQLEGKIKTALDPVFKMIADEMKKAVQFYQTEEKAEPPTSAILSGGTAGMPDIISYLSKYLGLEVVVANPFNKVAVDPTVMKSLAGYAPLYSIAVGLALRKE